MKKRNRMSSIPEDAISGIFNYCDRWCERCEFTSRCSVFAMEQADDEELGPESRDPKNRAFWKRINANFAETLVMLQEKCVEMGIDPDEPLSPEEKAREEETRLKVSRDELVCAGNRYCENVHKWLEASESLFDTKREELLQRARLELPNAPDPETEAIELHDLLDVVQWYHTLIAVKVQRAVHGAVEGVPDIIKDMPRDSDGSAKVALISMDRSISAWARLRAHFPEQKDAIIDTLLQLDRLRRGMEAAFPKARAFVRPGFDEQQKTS